MAGTAKTVAQLEAIFVTGAIPVQQDYYDLFATFKGGTLAENAVVDLSSHTLTFQKDLGLAGLPFQSYTIATFKRSTGAGAGIALGYGTRGFSDPGAESIGTITVVGGDRLMMGTATNPTSFYIGSSGGIVLGSGVNVNTHNDATILFLKPVAFGSPSTFPVTGISSPTLYSSSNVYGSGAVVGDLIIQPRNLAGKVLGFATGATPTLRMVIADAGPLVSIIGVGTGTDKAFRITDSAASEVFSIQDNGFVRINNIAYIGGDSQAGFFTPTSDGVTPNYASGKGILVTGASTTFGNAAQLNIVNTFNSTSNNQRSLKITPTFSPTGAGTNNFAGLFINSTYNANVSWSGDIFGILYSPTVTNIGAGSHYAFKSTSGNMLFENANLTVKGIGTGTNKALSVKDSAGAEKFYIQDNGNVTLAALSPKIDFLSSGTIVTNTANGGLTVQTKSTGQGVSFTLHNAVTTTTTTFYKMISLLSTFAPTTGAGAFTGIEFTPTYNQTGTASGDVVGILYNPTVTSVLGSHYAFKSTSGGAVFGNPFAVFNIVGLSSTPATGVVYITGVNNPSLTLDPASASNRGWSFIAGVSSTGLTLRSGAASSVERMYWSTTGVGIGKAPIANVALDIRGGGTGTNQAFRIESSAATETFTVLDNGTTQVGSTIATPTFNMGNSTTGLYAVTSTSNMTVRAPRYLIYSSSSGPSGSKFAHTFYSALTGGTGVYGLVDFGSTSTFAKSSGSDSPTVITILPAYNFTGTYSGTVRGIFYNPTLTSMTGATHYFIQAASGRVLLGGLPTSSAGLATGELWNNSGVVNIV